MSFVVFQLVHMLFIIGTQWHSISFCFIWSYWLFLSYLKSPKPSTKAASIKPKSQVKLVHVAKHSLYLSHHLQLVTSWQAHHLPIFRIHWNRSPRQSHYIQLTTPHLSYLLPSTRSPNSNHTNHHHQLSH